MDECEAHNLANNRHRPLLPKWFAENIEESPDEPKIYEFEEITVTGSPHQKCGKPFSCASRRPIQ